MIEVEGRVDHHAHVGRRVPQRGERVLEPRAPVGAGVLHAVDVGELGVFLVAEPRVDEHEADVVLHEEAAHAELDAVARVGRDSPLPEWLGHHAEHRPAIELLEAGLQRMDAQAAERARLDEWE